MPINRIILVDEIVRPEPSLFRSSSLPGHLIHVVESGEVRQEAEGRCEIFREGHAVWYHENEPIQGRILRGPWRFITINFEAHDLAPPADDSRVLPVGPQTLGLARKLLELWRSETLPSIERNLRSMSTLTELLLDILPLNRAPAATPVYPANARECWWGTEKKLRQMLDQPLPVKAIAEVAGLSVRTTIRACKAATGLAPARRVRELKLAYATSLLQHTDLSVTEIAARVGYARVQEFSRDYRKQTSTAPSTARNASPGYLRQK